MGRPTTNIFSLMTDEQLVDYCRKLVDARGIEALTFPALNAHQNLYFHLYKRGIPQKELVRRLGMSEQFQHLKDKTPIVRAGVTMNRRTWPWVVTEAGRVMAEQGFLPPAGWFQQNGQASLVQAVYSMGKTWDQVRDAVGDSSSGAFVESRNGLRWRSHPEASMSNFLYARGIPHRRGERYPEAYELQSGGRHGHYDLHFQVGGRWIDVEIWGDNPGGHGADQYGAKRRLKEKYNQGNAGFLGIHFEDCFVETRLGDILEPFIGRIAPFIFERPTDRVIPSTHWSNTDELLEACRELAIQQPNGAFPTEEWLRKRGKWANRPGPAYNTMSIYIKLWFGGVRQLRTLLGQSHVSTTRWDREAVLTAWQAFWQTHSLTPNQARAHAARGYVELSTDVLEEAGRLVSAVVKYAGGAAAANAELGITVQRGKISRRI